MAVRPLPPGLSVVGSRYRVPAESITFLADRTYVDAAGDRFSEQQIFDEVLAMIARAEHYVLLDMFLYNDWQGNPPETTRALSSELTQALVAKKQANPNISITVVSDPLNTVYGGQLSTHWQQLQEVGISVVITDLTRLRDSNPGYSVWWRALVQWFGNSADGGLAPHPFQYQGATVTVRSWLSLLNFKANHRKLLVADEPQADGSIKLAVLVTSANPHDGSSAHSNVALKVVDSLWQEAVVSEQAVAAFSGQSVPGFTKTVADEEGETVVQLLTESAILQVLVAELDRTKVGDSIDLAMFYLSERLIIKRLLAAAERGVTVRLLLDPNKDAFGHTKNGVPNRPVAHELVSKSGGEIAIRWCDTHGEQCHTKLILIEREGSFTMIVGSANLTRRNLRDLNLETNVLVSAREKIPSFVAADDFFEEIWTNREGRIFSTAYETYLDTSIFKKLLYRFQEATGLSSF